MDELYKAIQESTEKALEWLAKQQNSDGSWGQSPNPNEQYMYSVGVTGLVLLKFETYALEIGLPSPFDERYIYKDVVENGLNYLFKQAKQDVNGIFFQGIVGPPVGYEINYSTGIALAAICANKQQNRIVNSTNTIVNGKSYKEVANSIVSYLTYSQDYNGGWGYYKDYGCPDNSVTGYTVLGLDFARAWFYCNISSNLIDKLKNWIVIIQDLTVGPDYGGSKYSSCYNPSVGVNILKTGNLLEELKFCGYPESDPKVQKAMTYIANTWDNTTCPNVHYCVGWKGDPADYQATFTTMKGLSEYGVTNIVNSSGQSIDWFVEMANVILAQQNDDGSWNFSHEDNPAFNKQPILSTAWAILKLERVTILECNGTLEISKESCKCIACIGEKIPYTIKLKNKGPGTSYNIIVNDIIPTGVYVASMQVSRGNIFESNGVIIWSIPELRAWETAVASIVEVATDKVCFESKGVIINRCKVISCAGVNVTNLSDTVITNIECFGCNCCKRR